MTKREKRFLVVFIVGIVLLCIIQIIAITVADEEKTIVRENSTIKNNAIRDSHQEEVIILKELDQPTHQEALKNPKPENSYARIMSFGDCLVHKPVFDGAYDSDFDIYDFSSMFKNVAHYFDDADVVIGNNESPYAGPDRGYSGYPCFNAPEHLAIDLNELGVDIVSTANNHCLDKGYDGLYQTLHHLDDAGIKHVGTARSQEEQNNILFMNLNGIKTAFLSYTYGTNGIQIPEGKEYCVNLIDENFILKQIETSKDQGAEMIVASMHWGVEYQTKQNSEQEELAKFLAKNGVNIILGCHPHVLQPMKMIGDSLVIYSQGNFFSAQKKPNTRETAIFDISVKKDGETGKISIENASYHPVYVQDNGVGTNPRFELLDLEEILSHADDYSESEYNLATKEFEICKNIIEVED